MIVHDNGHVDSNALRRQAWCRLRPAGTVDRLPNSEVGWDAGIECVDRAVDAGAGVLLLLDDASPSAHARAIAALYSNCDVTAVVPTTNNDMQWMRDCGEVRDALVAVRAAAAEPSVLLARDARLAAATSMIVRAATRRTPVVVDGVLPHIAALAAQRISSQSTAYVFSGRSALDGAYEAASRRLELRPWSTTDWSLHDGNAEILLRALVADLDAAPDQ